MAGHLKQFLQVRRYEEKEKTKESDKLSSTTRQWLPSIAIWEETPTVAPYLQHLQGEDPGGAHMDSTGTEEYPDMG